MSPCIITHHSVSQIFIVVVLLQMFQWFDVWCFLYLTSWVGLGATWMTLVISRIQYDGIHSVCSWVSINKARIVQCLSLHISFWTSALIFGLMTVWGSSCLGVSVIHFLPVLNIQSQFTAGFFGTRATPCIWLSLSAAWHPSITKNWIVILWSCLGGLTDWYCISKLCCTV